MKYLVRQDAGEFRRAPFQFLIQHDLALPHKGGRMHRLAMRAIGVNLAAARGEGRKKTNTQAMAAELRQPPLQRLNALVAAAPGRAA